MSIESGTIYDIWLSMCSGVGKARAKLLVDYFDSAEKIYNLGRKELLEINGIGKQAVSGLINKDLKIAEKILSDCEDANITVLGLSDKSYPERLRHIYDPPTVLYVKGKLPDIDEVPVIGVVGTRMCTPYGIKNAEEVSRKLSRHGIIVATGLARGVDTAAATGALGADMPVIGVVGCGADVVYPPRNRALFEKVVQKGAIVSEYLPGTEARAEFFPPRNRIISGLSVGVAVIEAPEKSGALITAQNAMEQGRDVFVLPGNVDAIACMGSNRLLRDGAIPFMTAEDIIDEYRDLYPGIKKPIDNGEAVDYIDLDKPLAKLCGNEVAIVKSIRRRPLYIDEIIENTGISAQTALASLTGLELGGYVRRDNIGKWEIAN